MRSPRTIPGPISWAVVGISFLPILLFVFGFDLGTTTSLEGASGSATTGALETISPEARGALFHTLMEWSAAGIAIITALLAFAHFRMARDIVTPVIGMALLCAASLDAMHMLMADRIIETAIEAERLVPFTWAFSRLVNATILIVGAGIFLTPWRPRRSWDLRVILPVAAVFVVGSSAIMYALAASPSLPQAIFPGATITRPWDVLALLVFALAGTLVLPRFYRTYPSIFSHALLLSTVPQAASQLYMVFGSEALYDNHFTVAHSLKVVAYGVLLLGLVLDYLRAYSDEAETVVRLEETQDQWLRRQSRMRLLFEIAARTPDGPERQLQEALKLTTDRLGMDVAIISRICGDSYTVEQCYAPGGGLEPGDRFPLGDTYCSICLDQGDVLAIGHMARSVHQRHPCYERFGLETYLGTAVRVHGERYGTLNISAAAPRERPFEDADLEFIELLGLWVGGVIERKLAEQRLRDSQKRLEMALRGADLGLWDWNIQTGDVVFNERWANMLGYELDEVTPDVRAWEKLVHPDDMPLVSGLLQAHLAGETPSYETEHRMRTKSGEWIWVLDRGKVLERDADGAPRRAAGTHLDITERKRTRDVLTKRTSQLERANGELHRKNAEIRRMYHTLCHELKTPLTAAREFISIVLDELAGPVTEEQKVHLTIAQSSCDVLTRHMNDLLDMTRLETGKLSVEPVPTDMATLIARALASSQSEARERGLSIRYNLPFAMPAAAVDPHRIGQVVTNLMSNALKFTRSGGSISVALEVAEEPDWLKIEVSDTGRGIPPDQLDNIFDRLYQVSSHDWATQGGLGLGLYLCDQIVRLHGGTISVKSEVDVGTTFSFTVPIAGARNPDVRAVQPSLPAEARAAGQGA